MRSWCGAYGIGMIRLASLGSDLASVLLVSTVVLLIIISIFAKAEGLR